MYEEGEVYFDDVRLELPNVALLEPMRFVHLYGQPVPISANVWISTEPENGELPELVLKVTGPDGTVIKPEVKITKNETLPKHYTLHAMLPAISEGHYTLSVLKGESRTHMAARTYRGHAERKPARLDDTGNIIYRGMPFFPIGMYHPQNWTYYNVGGTNNHPEGVEQNYALLAENGFNAI